jgi:hypothetical protein
MYGFSLFSYHLMALNPDFCLFGLISDLSEVRWIGGNEESSLVAVDCYLTEGRSGLIGISLPKLIFLCGMTEGKFSRGRILGTSS